MSIIDYMRYLLINYPKIAAVCNTVNIDFLDNVDDSYGLSSMGDVLLKRDILGNQTRQHNFMLYATYQSVNDFDRLNNSGVLLDLSYYLDSKNNDVNIDFCLFGRNHDWDRIKYFGRQTL